MLKKIVRVALSVAALTLVVALPAALTRGGWPAILLGGAMLAAYIGGWMLVLWMRDR